MSYYDFCFCGFLLGDVGEGNAIDQFDEFAIVEIDEEVHLVDGGGAEWASGK